MNTHSQPVAQARVDIDREDDIIADVDKYVVKQKVQPLTSKQQKFVQLFVYQDLTNSECAFRAGYKHPKVVASQLLHHPDFRHVQDKIQELQEGEQKKYEITFDKVARDLKVIRDAALEDGSYGAAVSAELGRAKLAGLMVERKEIKHGSIDQMDRAEVESRLRQLIESNQLAPVLEARIENSSPDVESDEELVEEFEEVEEEIED
jgi:phage terminase small subunit